MDRRQKVEMVRMVGNAVKFSCPMAKHTTFRVGGEAEALYEAENTTELCRVLGYLAEEKIPYMAVGKGSNLLVKDGGLRGVVIMLAGSLADLHVKRGKDILAGAGLSVTDLLARCREEGLAGLEFLAGIPGTVGGAVAMNSGAFGKEISSRVIEMQVATPCREISLRGWSGLRFSYRGLALEEGALITQVSFCLDRGEKKAVSARIADYLKRRKKRQPIEYPSAGSVFKNPSGDYAGRLIERTGLKGKRIGGAMISNRHANFIVNRGGATAADILALIDLARKEVRGNSGVDLELEIIVAGD